MAEQRLVWDDSVRMVLTVAGKIYTLTWIDAEEMPAARPPADPVPYKSGWYYDEDGPPGYMGVTREEVVVGMRAAFAQKQQLNAWRDEDLLYALCAVCKAMDQGEEGLTLRSAFIGIGYGLTETDLALDLIYKKVLE